MLLHLSFDGNPLLSGSLQDEPSLYSELEIELKTVFAKFEGYFKNIDFGYLYNDKFDLLEKIEKKS
ncbi:hypothetical protein [Treponema pectinovorum]|uniref:hypothetical protein n=1 Tax=Treponema pectinovorum TaxID=164 RepID=UPI0011F31BC9|nr:hypothetical protein [Treponema pectinovorum]